MPEVHNDDPITSQSYSFSLLIWSFVLMLTLAWALYDEIAGLRPWRTYQTRFAQVYTQFLNAQAPVQQEHETAVRNSPELAAIEARIAAAEQAVAARITEIDEATRLIDRQIAAVTPVFQTARAEVTALIYQHEIASERAKPRRMEAIERVKARTLRVNLPQADGSSTQETLDYPQLEQRFTELKDDKARLLSERAEVLRPAAELRRERDAFLQEKMIGLTATQVSGLLNAVRRMNVSIRQVADEDQGLVDRCQSCHIAMDTSLVPPTLTLTRASLGLEEGAADAPFTTHPSPELLRIHNPERFGCSPCHGGNGRATSSVVKGHGRHKYWLWPLHYPENFESGCQQCHSGDMVTEHAPTLNRGRELFREKGCIGCHRYEGFDNEGEQLLSSRLAIRRLAQQRRDGELEIPRILAQANAAEDNAIFQALNQKALNLTVEISNIDTRVEQLNLAARDLMREEKKVGPSLKEVRVKLHKEWIPYWLTNTHDFRPGTKMPQFRLSTDEVQAISAFIWQMGVPGPIASHPAGNAARGKTLVETRGCLGCHSVGEGDREIGGDFAANLSRVGEKASYDYLVRWVHNPRERTRPYDPIARKDLGPEDYAAHGKPFAFDLVNSRSPDGKNELQVQQATVMPSLRLSWEDSRDIASYLITLKRPGASYPAADFMDNASLRDRGRQLAKEYGCAGCHEIATLEDEGRIGTELTAEGSKPIERLDFAMLTSKAKRGILPDGSSSPRGKWYDVKGFVEQKLLRTNVYDDGKFTRTLRMPQPNVSAEDIRALTTFIIGSVDATLPASYRDAPTGDRADVQAGWWLITKYNCAGCHQLDPGQRTALEGLPQYQGENRDKLPPPLFGVGARLNPNWLAHFLDNPALSTTDTNRNGIRYYLETRMPTFSLSESEVRRLVRFFEARSGQARPFLPPRVQPLTDAERQMARQLFTHPAAPCLRCHATGDPAHDRNANAPNFLTVTERLRPSWTGRWLTDPARMIPGTAMPSGLFRLEGERWIFAGPLPPALRTWPGDHADLLVRYMFTLTPAEQRALLGRGAPNPPGGAGND